MRYKYSFVNSGFAIIELLVIVVVIGVIATAVAQYYSTASNNTTTTTNSNGEKQSITSTSHDVSLQSDLSNISQILKLDQAMSSEGNYPESLTVAHDGQGITASPGVKLQYFVDNTANPKTFCVSAASDSVSYVVTNDSIPAPGICYNE